MLALPGTPLFDRLGREGRLKPTAGDQHQLWNNLIATNVVPLRMTEDEMLDGFRDLMVRVASDEAIAGRVRTKLRQFGRPPLTFGLSAVQVLRYLMRFLWRGVLPGGPRRWTLVVRSLMPARRDPRLIPFAILNWSYGLAVQAFVQRHLKETERKVTEHVESTCSMVECPTA